MIPYGSCHVEVMERCVVDGTLVAGELAAVYIRADGAVPGRSAIARQTDLPRVVVSMTGNCRGEFIEGRKVCLIDESIKAGGEYSGDPFRSTAISVNFSHRPGVYTKWRSSSPVRCPSGRSGRGPREVFLNRIPGEPGAVRPGVG